MSFSLKSTNEEFSKRHKNVFDQLKVLENNRKNTSLKNDNQMETDEAPDNNSRTQRSITKHFRGKESIFKKPQNPAPKNFFNRIPDFKKNPHKWTKYSLEDVRDEDMSERGNTKAALSFLEQLEAKKNHESNHLQSESELPKKIIFKRRVEIPEKKKVEQERESKPSFRSSKVVMPEYVIGQKVKKDKKNKDKKNMEKGKELKLDHLLKSEEEEDN